MGRNSTAKRARRGKRLGRRVTGTCEGIRVQHSDGRQDCSFYEDCAVPTSGHGGAIACSVAPKHIRWHECPACL